MWCGDVNYINVFVLDELLVGTVCFRIRRASRLFEEFFCARLGRRGGCSDDGMFEMLDTARVRVDKQVLGTATR
jgi:hypothetical protein